MTGATRRVVRIMDLVDDPEVLAAYDEAHRPGSTPEAVLAVQRRHGIEEMEIYRAGNRLVMILTLGAGFDAAALAAAETACPEVAAWQTRMGALQRAPLPDAAPWPEAHLVFRQSEHP